MAFLAPWRFALRVFDPSPFQALPGRRRRWWYAPGVMDEEDLDTPEMRALLRTLGARPSRSAEAARAREIEEIRALSVEERILLALRLGKRDRTLRAMATHKDRAPSPGRGSDR